MAAPRAAEIRPPPAPPKYFFRIRLTGQPNEADRWNMCTVYYAFRPASVVAIDPCTEINLSYSSHMFSSTDEITTEFALKPILDYA